MSKTFDVIRGESVIIAACYDFSTSMIHVPPDILESTLELLTYTPTVGVYEDPIKQMYITMVKALITLKHDTEKLRNR